jgi:hypothetical protein
MPLTATQINQAKPRELRYNLKDENGLYLEISPAGSKLWRVRYGSRVRKIESALARTRI